MFDRVPADLVQVRADPFQLRTDREKAAARVTPVSSDDTFWSALIPRRFLPIDFSFERIAIRSKQIWSRFFLIRIQVCPDPAYVLPIRFSFEPVAVRSNGMRRSFFSDPAKLRPDRANESVLRPLLAHPLNALPRPTDHPGQSARPFCLTCLYPISGPSWPRAMYSGRRCRHPLEQESPR